ncbi:hypothetical protein [Kordia zhangzhouensis]|uniref:hypothetical protein n=1 Tax=Kordia zhangzhouensis TaxID=1620405 RepID=UPI000629BFF2|nr:hypothetical protein [Kordia zhangzhouensis]
MKKIITILSILLFISCANYGEKKVFNGTEVYYKNGVTEAEANKLGQSLITSGFTDGNLKSVQYSKDGDKYIFKMVIKESFLNNEKYEQMFSFMPKELSSYMGVPVDFHLTDDQFNTLRAFKYEDAKKTLMAKATEIRYTKSISKEEVEKLRDFLIDFGFSNDEIEKTVEVDKENNKYILKIVVEEGYRENKTMEAFLTLLKNEASKKAFNSQPVKVHMCDELLNTIKEI